jgi:hypothetical protein
MDINITLEEYRKLLAIAYAAESVVRYHKEDLEGMKKVSIVHLTNKVKEFTND